MSDRAATPQGSVAATRLLSDAAGAAALFVILVAALHLAALI